MAFLLDRFHSSVLVSAVLLLAASLASGQDPKAAEAERGGGLFLQQCSFCHGRDAGGGEDGPDLTRSKLVAEDAGGDKIAPVIRNGRMEHGMPRFNLSDSEIAGLVAFIHAQKIKAESQKGGRRGVDAADLQTGNVDAGKQYFNGAGKCATCHSPTGDLAGIAARFEGLKLEERMLYPRGAKSKVTVTLASGESLSGELAYLDEFTVAMRDSDGRYRSWRAGDVKYTVDAPGRSPCRNCSGSTPTRTSTTSWRTCRPCADRKGINPMKLPAILFLALSGPLFAQGVNRRCS